MGLEKRRHERYTIDKDVQVIISGHSVAARVVNASKSGAAMRFENSAEIHSSDVMVLRCLTSGKIVDFHLAVRHVIHKRNGLFVGLELINELKNDLVTYLSDNSTQHTMTTQTASVFHDNIVHIASETISKGAEIVNINPVQLQSSLDQNQELWTSYIGLSSPILTTKIYLSYDIQGICNMIQKNLSEHEIHDFMREKTNVIAGSIKRWILSHKNIDEAVCENFKVLMPATEKFNRKTLSSLTQGHFCKVSKSGSDIFTCSFLQIDDDAQAETFLSLLSKPNLEELEETEIEFL